MDEEAKGGAGCHLSQDFETIYLPYLSLDAEFLRAVSQAVEEML